MALDATGRYAILSGRKNMCLIDLDGEATSGSGSEAVGVNSSLVTKPTNSAGANQSQSNFISSTPLESHSPRKAPVISKRLIRNSKYEPTACQFSRHMPDLYALTTNQVIDLYSLEDLNPQKPKLVLRGHSRTVTDIEWSHFDPCLLGSSSADCTTNLWDVRDGRRPSASLSSVSGTTHVRFSKTSSYLMATGHEIDVRIWDIRQRHLPLYYIAAHLQKISGMDWSPERSTASGQLDQLITCSQDSTVKLWTVTGNNIKPSANFSTRSPVWRVRYTPISSNAILTSTLPQLRSRNECMALRLWSMKRSRHEQKKLELILNLVGHSDVIVDFDWRYKSGGLRGAASSNDTSGGGRSATTDTTGSPNSPPQVCEFVSWSKDHSLRVWRIDQQFIEMNVESSDSELECDAPTAIGAESGGARCDAETVSNSTNAQAKGAGPITVPKSTSSVSLKSPSPAPVSVAEENIGDPLIAAAKDNLDPDEGDSDGELAHEQRSQSNELKQEFSLINKNIPNLEFEELNYLRRVCMVSARAKTVACRLRIALPPNYPQNDCPTFTLIDTNQFGCESLNKEAKEKLLNLLYETAKSQLARSRNCIEPCLRKFVATLQRITSHNAYKRRLDYKDDPITLSAQNDHSVPFPPTSGARFCGNILVCFGRPLLTPAMSHYNAATGNDAVENDRVGGSSSEATTDGWHVKTPRSMAQLSAQLDNMRRQGSYNLSNISISYFYYGVMRRAELQSRAAAASGSTSGYSGASRSVSSGGLGRPTGLSRGRSSGANLVGGVANLASSPLGGGNSFNTQSIISKSYKCGPVTVYDVSTLVGGLSRDLAESYVFDKDVIKMCRKNAAIAGAHNRHDLVQIWSLAELSSEGVLNSYLSNRDPSSKDFFGTSSWLYDSDFGDRPWTMHPFGSKLIQSLIDHYVYNCCDVQTAAMLVWTFSSPKLGCSRLASSTNTSKSNVASNSNQPDVKQEQRISVGATGNQARPHHHHLSDGGFPCYNEGCTVVESLSGEWNFVNGPEPLLYSNSWSQSTLHDHLTASDVIKQDGVYLPCCNKSPTDDKFLKLNILKPERALQNDLIMHVYAELLYRLNLLNQRAMVLKNIGIDSPYTALFGSRATSQLPPQSSHNHNFVGDQADTQVIPNSRLSNLTIQCANDNCRKLCHSTQCPSCKKYSLSCSVCRLPVKGSCSVCLRCLHGGHVNHFNSWFDEYDFCPTGCGCKCLTRQYS